MNEQHNSEGGWAYRHSLVPRGDYLKYNKNEQYCFRVPLIQNVICKRYLPMFLLIKRGKMPNSYKRLQSKFKSLACAEEGGTPPSSVSPPSHRL